MPATMKELGIDQWSKSDLIQLIEEIELSLTSASDLPDWHHREIEKRLATWDEDPKPGTPWREAMKEIWSES